MPWAHLVTILAAIIGTNVALFCWVRTETRADFRALQAERSADIKALQAERNADNMALQAWTQNMIKTIQEEIKDFHGRLCTIEERRK